ncbi:hypothetical protein AB0B71_01245 [Micromonospora echinofusca]|uniref:hypothetical protein n=1 Tax=Micromonospora echinofusca TaxID=47858 RepID=UPI0033CFC162
MASALDIGSHARRFSEQLQDLLNHTVCDHAIVKVVIEPDGASVGTKLDKLTLQSAPVRLRSPVRRPIWIDVSCKLMLDVGEGLFPAVRSSYVGIYLGAEAEQPILHYDFEREKEKYTEAHVQVYGRHEPLEEYLTEVGAKDRLEKLHLPVGGRRFRPSLEDIIEFLVAEKLVSPKAGWAELLDEQRQEYRRKQIAAVVRRNPGSAIRELDRLGYTILPPTDESFRAKIAALIARTPKPRQGEDADVAVVARPVRRERRSKRR